MPRSPVLAPKAIAIAIAGKCGKPIQLLRSELVGDELGELKGVQSLSGIGTPAIVEPKAFALKHLTRVSRILWVGPAKSGTHSALCV
ncbi:MAG: hypothetical protein LC797_18800 [Chloroflexi bacterium]|nr:hypothetical protein [Chloroflexota bacterium]